MKVKRQIDTYTVTMTQEEVIQIWASLLYNKAHHKHIEMPTTERLIKEFNTVLDSPF